MFSYQTFKTTRGSQEPVIWGGEGNVYVIIGSHFVPLDGKFLLIALVIVKTLNVIVR